MHAFPHKYVTQARGAVTGDVHVTSAALPELLTAPPAEFDGPGDRWSPETLLTGAVANCFILTFRAVARAAKLEWRNLNVEVVGTLDRVERITQFTTFHVSADLKIASGADADIARGLLEKAEHGCLISNSLKATVHLETKVSHSA
jgi:peroxiredoxin-like protein